jgi:hypothetical protein
MEIYIYVCTGGRVDVRYISLGVGKCIGVGDTLGGYRLMDGYIYIYRGDVDRTGDPNPLMRWEVAR